MTPVHIRWLIRADMPEVLEIEGLSFPPEMAWEEQDFRNCLRSRNCIGMVAEIRNSRVIGYMVYELLKKRVELISLAVHPEWRRQGVGFQLVQKLKRKLSGRTNIGVMARETNLDAQLFFKAQDFAAVQVARGWYQVEDAYRMVYRVPVAMEIGGEG